MFQCKPNSNFTFAYFAKNHVCHTILPINHQELDLPVLHKIPSIPIIRRSIASNQKLQKRLSIEGNKYYSKIVASGKATQQILKNVYKSTSIKHTYSFEFDPYFANSSGFVELRKSFKKLKNTRDVNLIIRRLDTDNEVKKLCPQISKSTRMNKLRIEFPKTKNITEGALVNFCEAARKSFSLKSLNFVFVYLDGTTAISDQCFIDCQRKHTRLEEFKITNIIMKPPAQDTSHTNPFKIFRKSKLKRYDINISMRSGWCPFVAGNDVENDFMRLFSQYINLREMNFKISRFPVNSSLIIGLTVLFSQMPRLEKLSFEIMKNIMTEEDVLSFACGVSKIPQLKCLTFKLLNLPFSEEYFLIHFLTCISNLQNLQKINIYFRRVLLSDEAIERIVHQVPKEMNLQCSRFKKSLYFYRSL